MRVRQGTPRQDEPPASSSPSAGATRTAAAALVAAANRPDGPLAPEGREAKALGCQRIQGKR